MDGDTSNLTEFTDLNPDPEPSESHADKYAKTKEANPEGHREIHEMLLKGYTPTEISPIIIKKYGIDRHTGYRWIKTVLKRIGEAVGHDQKNLGVNIGLAVERLCTLYQRALTKDEFQIAFRCLQEISRLQGLTKNTEESPKVNGESKKKKPEKSKVDVSGLSSEELKKLVEGQSSQESEDV